MRLVLRCALMLTVAGLAWSQAFTDAAGVVAGGSVGVGAGKKVGEGISTILHKVDSTTASAAKPEKNVSYDKPSGKAAPKSVENSGGAGGGGTMLQVGPAGVVKDHSLVPPPPPVRRAAVVPPPPPLMPATPAVFQPVVMLPPPRQATPADLKTLASGTAREDVLKLGLPASRITMFDDGHLTEIYRYQTGDTTFGIVRLSDGSVASVQVH